MNPPAPSFVSIANRPGATAASLLTFLRSNHKAAKSFKDMPELKISDAQAQAVSDYIISLRSTR